MIAANLSLPLFICRHAWDSMQPAAPVPSDATASASMRADDEDVRSIAYKGVVRLMKGYAPPPNWLEVFSTNAALLGLTRLDDILEDCQRWQRSRRGGNPHNLTDDEILACGLFTYDLGMNGKREEVCIFPFV